MDPRHRNSITVPYIILYRREMMANRANIIVRNVYYVIIIKICENELMVLE